MAKETSAKESTLAFRTPQISSRASTSKTGRSFCTERSSPTTVHTAPEEGKTSVYGWAQMPRAKNAQGAQQTS